MQRRDFLKTATLAAGANAASAFAIAPHNSDASPQKPLGKIALDEHFMLPDFVEYYEETYPNISPEIAKTGLGVLPDFGDRRIEVMDRTHIDYPFEKAGLAAHIIDNAKVPENERIKAASGNSKRILQIDRPIGT